jgi:leucine-rich repeat protein SHOC2
MTDFIHSASLLGLHKDVFHHLLGYLDPVKDLSKLDVTSKLANERISFYFRSLWENLRTSNHLQAPIDISGLIKRVHQDEAINVRPFFVRLDREYKNYKVALPSGRPPLTNVEVDYLQLQIEAPYEATLVRIWSKIPRVPNLRTSLEIRNWLNDPKNSPILDRVTTLNLSGLNIPFFPKEIGQFYKLQKLDLSHNKLTFLPDEFEILSQLQELNLSHNRFATLPPAIFKLANLNKLNVSTNQLSSFPLGFLVLKKLEKLNLSYNTLNSLPPDIGRLKQLGELDLSFTYLSALPNEIKDLTQLTALGLEGNMLISIPEGVVKLPSLQMLNLSNNCITSLPNDIGKLRSLKALLLAVNLLTELPNTIGDLPNLLRLDLDGNQLSALPPTVKNLSKLQMIRLATNRFSSFPEVLTSLYSLTQLMLTENRIISIPDTILRLTQLTAIALEDNPLIVVPYNVLGSSNVLIKNNSISQLQRESRFPPASPLAKLYRSILQSSQSYFDKAIKTAKSYISIIYPTFSEPTPEEKIKTLFSSSLPTADQNLIFEMVWFYAGSQTTDDSQWGEHHVFEEMERFYLSVRKAITTKLERLPQEKKNMVYGKVWELAGKPNTRDRQWGEHNALNNLTRLADALSDS